MTLIKSISGIRGTIGGQSGNNLTPLDIIQCCAAYGTWLLEKGNTPRVVIGRDARISGPMVYELAVNALLGLGIDVVDLHLSTTPTVEMAVTYENAGGGIIITASHNPKQWNALKFLNEKGEFISAQDGARILSIIEESEYNFAEVDMLGSRSSGAGHLQRHIDDILALDLVDADIVKAKNLKVVVDCINSTGALAFPPLLDALGVEYELLYDDLSGKFAHNPEPLPDHLSALMKHVQDNHYDLGISVDPDVDRLVFICEDGSMFGEEYTIVALADYILASTPGNTVSNLSSTQALKDVTLKHGGAYNAAAVGEVNVVTKMKETDAVFGGEGNGGVIYPALHYGRDAMVGTALFLSYMGTENKKASELRAALPDYHISKNKVQLGDDGNPDAVIQQMKDRYADLEKTDIDGLKLLFPGEWVHMRKSNTEPIIRIYAESSTADKADELAKRFVSEIESLV